MVADQPQNTQVRLAVIGVVCVALFASLFARLYPALDALKISYEIVFINDGSVD